MDTGHFVRGDYHRSFLAFLYWFGVRRGEALALTPENCTVDKEKGIFIVNCQPEKKGERPPLECDYTLPYIVLILKQLLKTPPTKRIWRFSPDTAWKIVKRAMGEKYYPHFFRLNRATRFLEDPTTTIPEMLGWFGWKLTKTIDPYVGYSRRYIKTQSKRLKRELE